jgi:hypothetical protein
VESACEGIILVVDRSLSVPNWGEGTVSSFLPGLFPPLRDHGPNQDLGFPLQRLCAGSLSQQGAKLIAHPGGCPVVRQLPLWARNRHPHKTQRPWGVPARIVNRPAARGVALDSPSGGLLDSSAPLTGPQRVKRDNRPASVPTGSRHRTGANAVFPDVVDCWVWGVLWIEGCLPLPDIMSPGCGRVYID